MEEPLPPAQARIALAIEYPLLQQGGVEVLIRQLLPALAAHHELVLVSGDRDREALGDFARYVVAHHSWPTFLGNRGTARQLALDLAADGVKLIHFHGGQYEWEFGKAWRSPATSAAAAGIKCLATTHLVYPLLTGFAREDRPMWQRLILLPKTWLNRALILSYLNAEVLVSREDRAVMRRNFFPFADKMRHIYHSRLAREEGGPAQEHRQKVVLCLGTFCERKGQTVLARAFAEIAGKHADWQLHLVGRVDAVEYVKEIRQIAANAGLADRILIFPPVEDPRPLLAGASVFALPSFREGLPLSLQEALYYGCACVASRLSGTGELIEHDSTGLLVQRGDTDDLAAALDRLMSDVKLRSDLAQRARPAIEAKGMLAETMTENYLTLYRAILAGEALPAVT